jgi:hypothetical protein
MLRLKGQTARQAIAERIAGAVEDVLGCTGAEFVGDPVLKHEVVKLDLPMNALTESDARTATQEARKLREAYEAEKEKIDANPAARDEPRWYRAMTRAHRRMKWFAGVAERFEAQKRGEKWPVQLHVLRLGEVAFATNPFEYYLDHGTYIKARGAATQVFLVQLAGAGTYVPSRRSVAGGGYGSIPASNPVGPEGGRVVAETTVEVMARLWATA